MSEWRTTYQRLVRLEKAWAVHDHPGVNRQLFQTAVLSRKREAEIEREFASFGIANPRSEQRREASELRARLVFPAQGRAPDEPCEDVYQAALTMMPFGTWIASPSHDQLYRGQRDARWPVVPSFFRGSSEHQATGLARLNALARDLVARRPGLEPAQALALIQHYSSELSAPTWLIDLTWDPAVALFFASDSGKAGDIGVVTMLVRREWEALAAGGRNRLGEIRLIEVPDVRRIERQRALFLDTSHPDLLEQYVAHSVWFRQVDGLTFEDLDAEWPVSKARCYPAVDATLELIAAVNAAAAAEVSRPALAPPSDASRPLRASDYLSIAKSWCEEDGIVLEPEHAAVLGQACLVHSRLQEHRDQLSIVLRSLHRLRETTTVIQHAQARGQSIDLPRALRLTLDRSMTDAEHELLASLVADAAGRPGAPGAATNLLAFIASVLAELTPRLAELVVIGVAEATDERVEHDIEAVLDDPRFRIFDLRGAPDVRGIGALATDVGDAVRLVLVDGRTATGWMHRLTRAFLDRQDRMEFAEGWVERPSGRSVVIVWYGATSIGDLPPTLREPIVQFID